MDLVKILEQWPVLLVIYLLGKELVPPAWKFFFPEWAAARRRQEKAEDSERRDLTRREDRLFEIAEQIIASNTKLNFTLEHISSYLQNQSVFMREMSIDLARIYTYLRIDRTSPVQEQPKHEDPNIRELNRGL